MAREPTLSEETTMATKRNPFEELQRFFDRMGDQFAEFNDTWTGWGQPMSDWSGVTVEAMPLDIQEVNDELVVAADLPGFDRDEIDVTIDGNMLSISAEHATESEDEQEGEFIHRERTQRSVKRSVTLPAAVEEEAVSATYKNGVLTVELKKSKKPKGKDIPIE